MSVTTPDANESLFGRITKGARYFFVSVIALISVTTWLPAGSVKLWCFIISIAILLTKALDYIVLKKLPDQGTDLMKTSSKPGSEIA